MAKQWQTRAERMRGEEARNVEEGRDLAALARERDRATRSRPKYEEVRVAARRRQRERLDRRAQARLVRAKVLDVARAPVATPRRRLIVLAALILAVAVPMVIGRLSPVLDTTLDRSGLARNLPQLELRAVQELRALRVGAPHVRGIEDAFAVTYRVERGATLAEGRARRDCFVRFRVDRKASSSTRLAYQIQKKRACR